MARQDHGELKLMVCSHGVFSSNRHILTPLVGNTASFTRNSEHLINLIQYINLQNGDSLVSMCSACSLVEEAVQVIINKLCMDLAFTDHPPLQADLGELLEVCMETTCLPFEDKFC